MTWYSNMTQEVKKLGRSVTLQSLHLHRKFSCRYLRLTAMVQEKLFLSEKEIT